MIIKQLSIFVENKEGRLSEITQTLADNGIDIRALSIADTTDYGILRLIVNDPDKALKALKGEGMTVSLTDVIAIAVPDTPGGLNKAVKVLSSDNISIEYMYAFLNPRKDTAFVILRVENNERAIKALTAGGIRLMKNEEIYSL
ncbi:MAG TPA: ACT domain-containing protein [Firmicutes bacterium]|nr:ACT domain-containing protein [Bacillota bacterium]